MQYDHGCNRSRSIFKALGLAGTAMAASFATSSPALAKQQFELPAVTVVATGLDSPRGLKFGPDGNLYVAEGGPGGDETTVGQCEQAPSPIGPYTGQATGGRISMIDHDGVVTTVTDQLPTSKTNPLMGFLASGVADVAFVGNTLYALLAGAGCSHGVANTNNGIVRVNPDHSTTLVANLSSYQMANPTAVVEEDDFEPDGTWYSMVSVRGDLYAVEPNHGEIVRVSPNGNIARVVDVSAYEGHVVPTAIAYHGNFYFANLNTFPQEVGSAKVWKLTPNGRIQDDLSGFDMVLGLVFDKYDRMYVLELSAEQPAPAPFTGRITRVQPNGERDIVADGLMFPTGMTYGPDGNLYVSTFGLGTPPGSGQVVRVDIANWYH